MGLIVIKYQKNFTLVKWFDVFLTYTAQIKMFSIKDSFRKCDQIRRKLRIWSNLLKKPLIENFIFCAVKNGWHIVKIIEY